MTTHVMVSVLDTATATYQRPFAVPSKGAAIRAFSDEVRRDGSDLSKHPTDYILYLLGSFDDVSGEFVSQIPPEILIRAVDV